MMNVLQYLVPLGIENRVALSNSRHAPSSTWSSSFTQRMAASLTSVPEMVLWILSSDCFHLHTWLHPLRGKHHGFGAWKADWQCVGPCCQVDDLSHPAVT